MSAKSEVPSLVDFEYQNTPFYTEKHKEYRTYVRKFFDNEIAPHVENWYKKGRFPKEMIKKVADYGGVYNFPYGITREWNGHKWDVFYSIIYSQESARVGATMMGSVVSHAITFNSLLHFGKNEIHKRAIREIMAGEAQVSICVSELAAGSDVSAIQTTARRDGNDFIINGTKYWITAGARADWFIVLTRTGGKGYRGLTLFLVPRDTKGLFTSKLKVTNGGLNETASVTLANVRVPESNIVGTLNDGFKPVMYSFNNERVVMVTEMVAMAKLCVDESVAYARKRKTFGKYLSQHQVIRHKIAEMSRRVLATHCLLEYVAYQLKVDPLGSHVPGLIALLKVDASRTVQYCTIEASQVFGGRSCVEGGVGARVERAYRGARISAIAGGSEEILLDLAMKAAKL